MLFDVRTYTCRPGTIALQMKLYEQYGLAPQKRHLGEPVFYGVTETGVINSYLHIWAYANAGDREARRAAMVADPDWTAYLKKSAEAGYLVRQENTLMTNPGFWAPK